MDLQQLIKEYLTSNKHMQLATISDSKPWICTVYFVADNDFNIYWMSARERQHSVEISNYSRVAVTVVQDSERKQALQITGNAYEVMDEALGRVNELYQSKFGSKNYDLDEIKKHKQEGRAFWMFKPAKISLWDEVNFPDSPKQTLELNDIN